jgi:DNA-binding transcriptional LysR family regulator
MDQLSAIRLFIRLVELGSFTKAANDLHVSQPTATKTIARLETKLGARLLHRSTHGVQTTEIGRLYYEKCRVISHHIEEAETVTNLLQSHVQGTIRISTSVAFGRRVMAPLLLRFMNENPKVKIDLSVEDRQINLVEQGIDLAIRMGKLADSSLGARYLGLNPWVVVASRSYIQSQGEPKHPQDLERHAALIYDTVQGDARWHFSQPDQPALSVQVQGPLRSNNLSALLLAACHGHGIAALPRYVAHQALMQEEVCEILSTWSMPVQEIHAVYPSPRLVPTKVMELVEWLQAHLTQDWWQHDPEAELPI